MYHLCQYSTMILQKSSPPPEVGSWVGSFENNSDEFKLFCRDEEKPKSRPKQPGRVRTRTITSSSSNGQGQDVPKIIKYISVGQNRIISRTWLLQWGTYTTTVFIKVLLLWFYEWCHPRRAFRALSSQCAGVRSTICIVSWSPMCTMWRTIMTLFYIISS